MSARDVSATLRDALQATGLDRVGVRHRPRLLSDNGPCYISSELQSWLAENGVPHTRGKPYHPMTQGKIERWHRTLKDRILLNNYYLPEELERQIDAFVNYYNTSRYHESLNNLTPYDVFTGQGSAILQKLNRIKEKTMILRKTVALQKKAGLTQPRGARTPPYSFMLCVRNYLTTDILTNIQIAVYLYNDGMGHESGQVGRIIPEGLEIFSRVCASRYRPSSLCRTMWRGIPCRKSSERLRRPFCLRNCGTEEAGTYQAVYTVRFQDAIDVLHAFQKQSKKGLATPKRKLR